MDDAHERASPAARPAPEREPATGEDRDAARMAEAIEAEAWTDMVAAAPPDLLAATGLRCRRVGGATCLLSPGVPVALLNRALGLGCEAPASEEDLEILLSTFRGAGIERFWIQVSPATRPASLDGWLRARGLAPDAGLPAWAKVLRGPGPVPEAATSLRVEPVGPERADELGRVLATAHQMPPLFAPWFAVLANRARWSGVAAFDGDRLVAGGLVYVSGDRAWLGAGGTLPSHRRRGGQGALLARRVEHALARGCTAVATETGDVPTNPSLHNMLRGGFRRVASRVNFAPAPA